MQILKAFALLFLLTFLCAGNSLNTNTTKMDLLYMQISEPYEHHFEAFKQTLKASLLDPIRSLFLDSAQYQELLEDDYSLPFDVNERKCVIGFNTETSQFNNITNNGSHSDRKLQQTGPVECFNGGFPVDTEVTLYICNDEEVSKAYYEANQGNASCSTSVTMRSFCYCPFDYYGTICESFNILYCSLNSTSNFNQQCKGKDSEYYVYSYSLGDMPCFFAERDSNLELKFQADCVHEDEKWAYEGIKTHSNVDYKPVHLEGVFQDYEINTEKLKISNHRVYTMGIRFINWRRLFQSYTLETQLTMEQLTGEKDIEFNIRLDSNLDNYRLAGRYSFEGVIQGEYIKQRKLTGFIEDSNYVEPKRSNSQYSYSLLYWIITLSVLLVILYKIFKNRIHRTKITHFQGEDYKPLIEMEDRSEIMRSD